MDTNDEYEDEPAASEQEVKDMEIDGGNNDEKQSSEHVHDEQDVDSQEEEINEAQIEFDDGIVIKRISLIGQSVRKGTKKEIVMTVMTLISLLVTIRMKATMQKMMKKKTLMRDKVKVRQVQRLIVQVKAKVTL